MHGGPKRIDAPTAITGPVAETVPRDRLVTVSVNQRRSAVRTQSTRTTCYKMNHVARQMDVAVNAVPTTQETQVASINIAATSLLSTDAQDDAAPMLVHGLGVFYPQLFNPSDGYFQRVTAAHEFQSLTESNKPSKAIRSGIYLSPVDRRGDELHFNLLRCSTNLSGPTDGFADVDHEIVGAISRCVDQTFDGAAPLNHVLAQTYPNLPAEGDTKQRKAKISNHADKTKDMPRSGVIAFCTFYDDLDGFEALDEDPFDRGRRGISALNSLRFRRKDSVDAPEDELPLDFTVRLYPGSVFVIPLSTNRLYTHEIRSSMLDASESLPTRLGYVVRCSSTPAVHVDDQTWLARPEPRVPLGPPTDEGVAELRTLYRLENQSTEWVDYGDRFSFSLNSGDYDAPRLAPNEQQT